MGYPVVLTQSLTDGAAITAAARTSCIPTSNRKVLPAGFFYPGRGLRIQASGRVSTVVTTPGTLRLDFTIGGTIVWDSLAIVLDTVAVTNMPWWFDLTLTCRANQPAASSNLWGSGRWTLPNVAGALATPPKGFLTAMLPWNTAPAVGANFDNGPSNITDFFFTQTAATGSFTVHQYLLEDIPLFND